MCTIEEQSFGQRNGSNYFFDWFFVTQVFLSKGVCHLTYFVTSFVVNKFRRSFPVEAVRSDWVQRVNSPKVGGVQDFVRSCTSLPPPPWCRRRSPGCCGCRAPESGGTFDSRTSSETVRGANPASKICLNDLRNDSDKIFSRPRLRMMVERRWFLLCCRWLATIHLLRLEFGIQRRSRDRQMDQRRAMDMKAIVDLNKKDQSF